MVDKTGHRRSARIERLARAHAPAYRELMQEAYAQAPGAWISTVDERASLPIDWWEDRIESSRGTSLAFGAFVGDALVGMAGIRFGELDRTRHEATLFGIHVAPSHRRMGLGRQLVSATLAHAASRDGVTVVQLSLIEGNASAAALYEACGFMAYAIEPRALRVDGTYRSVLHLWLELSGGLAGPRSSS